MLRRAQRRDPTYLRNGALPFCEVLFVERALVHDVESHISLPSPTSPILVMIQYQNGIVTLQPPLKTRQVVSLLELDMDITTRTTTFTFGRGTLNSMRILSFSCQDDSVNEPHGYSPTRDLQLHDPVNCHPPFPVRVPTAPGLYSDYLFTPLPVRTSLSFPVRTSLPLPARTSALSGLNICPFISFPVWASTSGDCGLSGLEGAG